MGRSIVQHINGMQPELPVITLDPTLEQILQDSVRAMDETGAGIEPGLAERLLQSLNTAAQQQEAAGQPAVLLVSPALRPVLSRFMRHAVRELHVLSYSEVPDNRQIKIVASVGRD